MWYLEDQDGMIVAGPFNYKDEAARWSIDNPGRKILFAVELRGEPAVPVLTKDVTPVLADLQKSGDVVLVRLKNRWVAIYIL